MKYAKLINGYPSYAPNPILHEGYRIGNPPPEILINMGYKPVFFTSCPEPLTETGYWDCTWTEDEQKINQVWTWYEPVISSPN